MKVEERNFNIGDLYVFTTAENPQPSAQQAIFGIYDTMRNGRIVLEVSSIDMCTFQMRMELPPEYRYARRSTRNELRLFSFNHGFYCAK